MSSSLFQRSICINCRITALSRLQQPCRSISARSAINKGIRASRDDGRNERGGRDRTKGFDPPYLKSSRKDYIPSRRASLSDRIDRSDRERDRRSDSGRRTSRPSDGERPRRARFGEPAVRSFSSRPQGRPELRSRDKADFRSRPSSDGPSLGGFRQREDSGFRSRLSRDSRSSELSSRDRDRLKPSSRSSDESQPGKYSQSRKARDSRYEQNSDESSESSKGGLLREIKTACQLIKTIQDRQTNGHGIDGLTLDAKATLDRINKLTTTGTFREDPAEAIADLLRKKAADGTFIRGNPRDSQASVIFQKKDGTLSLAIGQGGPARPSKPSRDVEADEGDRPRRGSRMESSDRHDKSSSKHNPRQSRTDIDEDDGVPVSVPYTTAASEFLYGYNSVLAALRAQRRKIYKLYIHPKIFERESEQGGYAGSRGREMPAHEFVSLAKEAKIPFKNEFNTRILDKMSEGRPHNGLVLEVSRLPALPVVSLGKPDMKHCKIPVTVGKQTAEEAAVNGNPTSLSLSTKTWRYPIVVLLDGITDPGNVGNILRTCHFYGVDAVAVAVNTCANLSSAVLAKASSGACEAVRLLSISQPSNFIFESSKFRWKVFAAVAPTSNPREQGRHLTTAALSADSPLAKHPCILMLGAEGEGLRENLKNRADQFISIAGGVRNENAIDVGVDSMNVSVAAGVLLESFLRKSETAPAALDVPTELGF